MKLYFLFLVALAVQQVSFTYIQNKNQYDRPEKFYDGFFNVVSGSEKLLDDTVAGNIDALKEIVDGCMQLINLSISEYGVSKDSLFRMGMIRDGFKFRVNKLVSDFKSKAKEHKNSKEKVDLADGLSALVYNVLSVLIENDDIGSSFSNMLSGAYKVVSAMVSSNKITKEEIDLLMQALETIFAFDEYAVFG